VRLYHGMIIALVLIAGLLQACITTKPLPTLTYSAPADAHGLDYADRRLLVFLRGIGGTVENFADYGMIAAAQARYPNLDVWVPNTHIGYYYKRSLLRRLQEDIVARAKRRGYRRIDFAGISLGGFGSLLYLECCQQNIDNVVLISPYSGEPGTHASIAETEDLRNWKPPAGTEDFELDLWFWIANNQPLFSSGRIWLGYGDEDYLSGQDLLAERLPENQVLVIDGDHGDEVFARIWQELLDKGALD
jgi:pimeloyl-ACP methyl ester carboxylesterase